MERYVPLRTSAKEEAPAERMGEQSDTKDLQGTVRVRRCLKPEKEEGREEGERLYPSLLRRDIANNVRQNKLVKSGKKEKREQEKVVAVAGAGAVNAETRYEVETNAEREITILTSNDHMVLRREEGKDEGGVFYRIGFECQRVVEEGAQEEVEEERTALIERARKQRRQ